jgi:hypothetical protein
MFVNTLFTFKLIFYPFSIICTLYCFAHYLGSRMDMISLSILCIFSCEKVVTNEKKSCSNFSISTTMQPHKTFLVQMNHITMVAKWHPLQHTPFTSTELFSWYKNPTNLIKANSLAFWFMMHWGEGTLWWQKMLSQILFFKTL